MLFTQMVWSKLGQNKLQSVLLYYTYNKTLKLERHIFIFTLLNTQQHRQRTTPLNVVPHFQVTIYKIHSM